MADKGVSETGIPSPVESVETQLLYQCALLLADLVITGSVSSGVPKGRVNDLYRVLFNYLHGVTNGY